MPSQIIFGRIVDTTCIYWSGGGGDGSTTEANGYCQLYDNTDLRYKLHFSVAAFLTASILAFCGTYVVSRTFNFHIDRGVRRDSIISAREVQMVLEDEGEEN